MKQGKKQLEDVYGLQAVYGGVQEKNTELDSELKKLRKENKGLEKKLTNYVNLDKEMAKARQKGTWLEKKKVKLAEKVQNLRPFTPSITQFARFKRHAALTPVYHTSSKPSFDSQARDHENEKQSFTSCCQLTEYDLSRFMIKETRTRTENKENNQERNSQAFEDQSFITNKTTPVFPTNFQAQTNSNYFQVQSKGQRDSFESANFGISGSKSDFNPFEDRLEDGRHPFEDLTPLSDCEDEENSQNSLTDAQYTVKTANTFERRLREFRSPKIFEKKIGGKNEKFDDWINQSFNPKKLSSLLSAHRQDAQ